MTLRKKDGRKRESEPLSEARERKMNRCADEQKEGEWMRDRKLEKAERERESRCKIHEEHLSRNIYETVAGNETGAGERGGKNGGERAARLE